MQYYVSNSHNAPFNLALEEFFLKKSSEDIFMLYRNSPSLIVGKHQNTLAEINIEEVEKQNIPVVRRLSGGGTVYHDMGNLNFCFIVNGERSTLVNFRKYTRPILDVLLDLGVVAQFEGKSDLTIDGMKISGNASHVYKNRIIHHGTLLFSSDLEKLTNFLKVNPLKYSDKAIRSVRSRVTNISSHLPTGITINEFTQRIMNHIVRVNPDSHPLTLEDEQLDDIHNLTRTKYETWQWNWGYSPNYRLEKTIFTTYGGTLNIKLGVTRGIIDVIELSGDSIIAPNKEYLINQLLGCPHQRRALALKLGTLNLNQYFNGVDRELLIKALF